MNKTTKYWVVIPAAGVGVRLSDKLPKQYLTLLGKTILEHTVECFLDLPNIEKIIVALNPNDDQWATLPLAQYEMVATVEGGEARWQSVLNALYFLRGIAESNDWILVHDAARPCVAEDDIRKLILTLQDHPVGGLLASRVRNTVHRSDNRDQLIENVSRDNLWQALTPQMFQFGPLLSALEAVGEDGVGDEAAAMVAAGHTPQIIQGQRSNIKVTYEEDLALAEFYLQQR